MAPSDNSFNQARGLGALQTARVVRDSASSTDRADFFTFRVTQRSSLQSSLKGLRSDLDFVLFDGDRNRIVASRNPGRQSEAANTILEQGRYFIKVNRKSGETQYRLRVAASPLAAPDPSTAKFVGLASDNSLAFFNSDNLANLSRVGVIGLQAGENLLGIDFRPNTGQLFGLGSTSRLYSISATGAATPLGTQPFTIALSGTSFGFDFNPTVDRLRVVSDTGQNLRLNPDTGAVVDANAIAGDGVQADGPLNGATNSIAASAYTNSFTGATATTLFGINTSTDQLFIQSNPNAGTQTLVGSLGVDFTANAAFDIVSLNGTNTAYAASNSSLYSLNLVTGAAAQLGEVRDIRTPLTLVGLATRP